MSKRLQVLIPDEEMETIRRQAKNERLSVGEYVRRALREVESRRPARNPAAKLTSIREAVRCSFPTADIEQMNREIERGYNG
ncbi:MAG: ribbon-helix-helix protein, CopG family [Candidatus Solibacter usitatus]|nr:ribbon-helix-helix protein, CopG family [Candidatus Solibacter usitatus]